MPAAPGAKHADTDRDHDRPGGVSFIRGSGEGRYVFEVQSGLVLGNAQDIGPIDVKAYDYMRSIVLLVQTTAAGGGTVTSTFSSDAVFNTVSYLRVKQPNGQTMYSVSSGYHAAMIQKYGLVRPAPWGCDPRQDEIFTNVGLGSQASLGGNVAGTRLNRIWKETVKDPEIENELRPLLAQFAKERNDGERFGDWCDRVLWKEELVAAN